MSFLLLPMALGVSVSLVRYLSVVWGGMLAGVAGGFLSIAYLPAWTQGMTAGMGWIAIALTIFAAWNPLQAIWGACFFGALYHLSFRLQAWIAPELLQMMPYACTILVRVDGIPPQTPPPRGPGGVGTTLRACRRVTRGDKRCVGGCEPL